MTRKYTKIEIEDIKERELKCLEFLKENQMTPSATMQASNIGDDTFGIKVTPFLNDTKYTENIKVQDLPITKE